MGSVDYGYSLANLVTSVDEKIGEFESDFYENVILLTTSLAIENNGRAVIA